MSTEEHSPGSDAPADDGPRNFIHAEVVEDVRTGRYSRPICTRFPPEPNGYWHIGHVLAITINHDTAAAFDGLFRLRFDDTNPTRERQEFVDAALEDMAWLGVATSGDPIFASDFFGPMYDVAEGLVRSGNAYVCDLSPEEAKALRGDYHRPGQPSPFRDRSPEENLTLLRAMRDGEIGPGAKSLRARIDMTSPNMNLRDPVLLRILHDAHYRQGTTWKVFPSYDFAQSFNDAFDGVTHSLCSSEFVSHRPLYDWLLEKAEFPEPPRQIEFGKIRIEGAVMGKRHIRSLIDEGTLSGWDDPRLLTVRGMRRRGFPASAILGFCRQAGVTRNDVVLEASVLEQTVREELNRSAARRMVVLDPIKLVIENLPEDEPLVATAPNNPADEAAGSRHLNLTRELFIDANDFMLDPPRKYHRLAPGKEVRLRGGVVVKCTGHTVDPDSGKVTGVRATYDPDTLGKNPSDGRKIRGVIHWVPAPEAIEIEVRFYDRLLDEDGEINQHSQRSATAWGEPALAGLASETCVQFERVGYFCVDASSTPGRLVFNQTVTLRDSWKKQGAKPAPKGRG